MRVKMAYGDFHNYPVAQGIFIQPELKRQFTEVSDLLYAALMERDFQQQHPTPARAASRTATSRAPTAQAY